jgi:hypothetical protein
VKMVLQKIFQVITNVLFKFMPGCS